MLAVRYYYVYYYYVRSPAVTLLPLSPRVRQTCCPTHVPKSSEIKNYLATRKQPSHRAALLRRLPPASLALCPASHTHSGMYHI